MLESLAAVTILVPSYEDGLAFFRDVLGFPFVDAGQGWLIFKLPPAEAAIHPSDAM